MDTVCRRLTIFPAGAVLFPSKNITVITVTPGIWYGLGLRLGLWRACRIGAVVTTKRIRETANVITQYIRMDPCHRPDSSLDLVGVRLDLIRQSD